MKTAPIRRCLAMIACVALAACSGGGSSGSSPQGTVTPTPTPSPSPTPTPTASAKLAIRGLVTMGSGSQNPAVPPTNNFEELNAHPGVYSAVVVDLFWSQLEPSPGTYDDSALTAALANIAAYNQRYPATPVVAKLRIFMGAGTPAWVMQQTGSVTGTDDQGHSLTVGKFWSTPYQTLWRALQSHLAANYDMSPMIGEVAITSCSSITGEPFILPQNKPTIAALQAAGFTDAAYMACLSGAAADYSAWQATPLDYTFNPYTATATGTAVDSTTFPISVMNSFRASLGARAVVANHGLDATLKPGVVPIYTNFQALYAQAQAQTPPAAAPLEFQTLSPTVDWSAAIALGMTYHPTEIEIWDTVAAGGSAPLTQQQLSSWAAMLMQ